MKGKLIKQENNWCVQYKMDSDIIATDGGLIPLSLDDVNEINAWEQIFDNLEARIATNQDVDFELEDYWETGLESPIVVARLTPKDNEKG